MLSPKNGSVKTPRSILYTIDNGSGDTGSYFHKNNAVPIIGNKNETSAIKSFRAKM